MNLLSRMEFLLSGISGSSSRYVKHQLSKVARDSGLVPVMLGFASKVRCEAPVQEQELPGEERRIEMAKQHGHGFGHELTHA